jgi:hypothetical protein
MGFDHAKQAFFRVREVGSMLAEFAQIRLLTDRFEAEKAMRGMVGFVLEVYPDGRYEVEFPDPRSGCNIAQIVVDESDVEPTNLDPGVNVALAEGTMDPLK